MRESHPLCWQRNIFSLTKNVHEKESNLESITPRFWETTAREKLWSLLVWDTTEEGDFHEYSRVLFYAAHGVLSLSPVFSSKTQRVLCRGKTRQSKPRRS